jgi:acetolactate synthase small subunit
MTAAAGLVHRDEKVSGLVVLTVYTRGDVAVSSRVLQAFTLRSFAIERFIVDFSGFDHREVKGLEDVPGDVLRMTIVASLPNHDDLERIGKLLNRIVDVYKVEHTFRI